MRHAFDTRLYLYAVHDVPDVYVHSFVFVLFLAVCLGFLAAMC